jgi:hypothetical protein
LGNNCITISPKFVFIVAWYCLLVSIDMGGGVVQDVALGDDDVDGVEDDDEDCGVLACPAHPMARSVELNTKIVMIFLIVLVSMFFR